VRLTLAETKTNTVQQRAAGAIVIFKLLYVVRHAWLTEAIVKTADRAIKGVVWNAPFRPQSGQKQGGSKAQLKNYHNSKGDWESPTYTWN
jgi:hypothetical protein